VVAAGPCGPEGITDGDRGTPIGTVDPAWPGGGRDSASGTVILCGGALGRVSSVATMTGATFLSSDGGEYDGGIVCGRDEAYVALVRPSESARWSAGFAGEASSCDVATPSAA
jgi:hypothetical protein